jgi:pre-mRNA 3'-end-processing factor FIP1
MNELYFLIILLCARVVILVPPPLPVRPASPLPPGVPTGPRNQNKYKDRDVNAPAVDGLDYGGNKDSGGGRTPSGEPEDRSGSR